MTVIRKYGRIMMICDEPNQQEREMTESMKPKVQWRCLKTDAPKVKADYWLYGDHVSRVNQTPSICLVAGEADDCNYFRPSQYVKLGYTHWAPYEAPEPPPKPTPFEAWWNKMPDPRYVGGDFRDVNTDIGTHVTNREVAKACFLAGYEACAKNMASGGVK